MTGGQKLDAVIIGAGHNGLVCAGYLAAKGLRVRLCERRDIVGGAAVTEEFHPGFRNSTASYTVSLLHPRIVRELRLAEHGLRIVERTFANFLPLPDGDSLKVGGGLAATQAEVARHSRKDAEALPAYYERLERVADVLRDLQLETPPNTGGGVHDLFQAWKAAKRFRALDRQGRQDVLDLFTMGAGDWLERWFESEPIKACFGFDAVVGSFVSPYAQGSAYMLLHHVFGEVNGNKGAWGHAIGGMGAITQALAAEVRRRGVEISVGAPVAEVMLAPDGHASGIRLADGTEVAARVGIGNVNPRLLLTQLVGKPDQGRFDLQRFQHYQCESASFRMNLALSELPDFLCLPGSAAQPHHGSGIIMAPSLGYMERAYVDARAEGWSAAPVVEMLLPSTMDTTLAPPGQHVASLFCQHFRYALPFGRHWDEAREAVADLVIGTVARYAPNFTRSVIARQIHSPLDLERKFGLVGGDIFHGKLTLNQLFSARPMLGSADYRTPIPGLYLCGAGAHPGGGVTGVPGHNAAREIWRDRRRWSHRRA
ncbi:MAG: NAD(P)/FAD-dependent oxidoreductase [Betaproteobacteria bacterium]